MSSRRRDERGAVAIIAAISALTLFGIAAMAVDLGNAFARERNVQASADFAALAGGRDLPGPATNTSANASAPSVQAVADYLNKNRPRNDGASACTWDSGSNTWLGSSCVTPQKLVDGDYTNGEVVFSNGGDNMTVYSPQARVDFGLANAIGFSHVNVSKSAELGLFSRGGSLPFYTSITCSWGSPQIIDTSNGKAKQLPATPDFITASTKQLTVTGLTISPDAIDTTVNGYSHDITISVSTGDLSDYSAVGFDTDNTAGSGLHYEVGFSTSGTSVTVTVPQEVLNQAGYWFVRLYKPGKPHSGWSSNYETLNIDAVAWVSGCGAGSNDGNFGSLLLSRDDSASGSSVGAALALNTILGPEHNLARHPLGTSAPTPCGPSDGSGLSVRPTGPPDPNDVNCVQTDTGNPQTATQGVVTGEASQSGHLKGLLDATKSGDATTCGPVSGSPTANDTLILKGTSYSINNDVLSCYFTNDTVSVAAVSSQSYSGPVVISSAVMQSPRFVFIPVLAADPGTGKKYWPLVTFRPAFITGQIGTATRTNPDPDGSLMGGAVHNGITWDNIQGLQTLTAVMINDNALPEYATWDGAVQHYLGSGTKIIRLIN